jgi:sodium/bile acid cotransporter 7
MPQHHDMPGSTRARTRERIEQMSAFCLKWFLPLGFLLALIVGLSWPLPGEEVASWMIGDYRVVQTLNVITIFVVSGLTLKTDDIKHALSREGRVAYGYGVIAILFITACAAFLAVQLPFSHDEFSYGLAVFCIVPTTLTSGVTLVTQAGGNGALALLLTVTTNMLGVVTSPFMLDAVLKSEGSKTSSDVSFDAVSLLVKLIVTVMIPLFLGKALREVVPGMKTWVSRHKTLLKVINNGSLVLIVWQTISRSADDLLSVPFSSIMSVIAAGIGLHILYLSVNWPVASKVLRLKPREFKCIVLMTSQKTLPISITIITFLGVLGDEGLMSIPPIIGHLSQLFIDSYIQSKWSAQLEAEKVDAGDAITSPQSASDLVDESVISSSCSSRRQSFREDLAHEVATV